MPIDRIDADDFDWGSEHGPAADVRRIAAAATAHDGTATLNEQAVLQMKYRGLRDAALWLWLAREQDGGRAQGFALRHNDLVDLAVHPDFRGQGVGTALAGQVAADGRKVEAWSHGDHPAAARIAARYAVPRERELIVMSRPTSLPLEEVPVPDGVTVRSYRPSDEAALLQVNATAFAHHPEQGHMTHEDFQERLSEPWFDPEGLFLAVPSDGGEPALLGFHWTKLHRDEDPAYGEVYVVAVNPKAAGRGLGTVLTQAGLRYLAEQGMASVLLYVDGDNDPAISVYTKQGFEVVRTEVQYRGVPRPPG